jgi:hypothetical protein
MKFLKEFEEMAGRTIKGVKSHYSQLAITFDDGTGVLIESQSECGASSEMDVSRPNEYDRELFEDKK